MILFKYIKRIPYFSLLLAISLLSAVFEGIGISALIPVLAFLAEDGTINSLDFPFNIIPEFMSFVGMQLNIENMLFLVLLLMSLAFLLVYIQERFIQFVRYKILRDNRDTISESIINSRWEYGLNFASGEVSNKLVHETDKLAETLMSVVLLISLTFQFMVYLAVAFFLSWQVSLVVLIVIALSFLVVYPLLIKSKKIGYQIVETNSVFSKQTIDVIKSFKLIKASNLERYVLNKFRVINKENANYSKKILDYASLIKLVVQLVLSITLISIVYVSLVLLEINLSKVMVFTFILIRMVPRYSMVQGAYRSFLVNYPAMDIVDQLKNDSEQNREQEHKNNLEKKSLNSEIKFSSVTFKYNNQDRKIINNVSFKIPAKSFTAIVGPSGAGKTTLLDLMMGLLDPISGSIIVDEKNLKNLDKHFYRKSIGFVPQENMFFNDTLHENLTFGNQYSKQLLKDILKISQLTNFVDNLQYGLNTLMGEGGVKLSGGQKQRVAIARALLKNPSILILDEATSSLDSKSEKEFQQALDNISYKYTLVVVAHRLSTIQKANNIVVIDNGEVIQEGSYDKLISEEGLFSSMVNMQTIKGV